MIDMAEVCIQRPVELAGGDKLTLNEIRSSSTDSGYVQCAHYVFHSII